MPTNKNDQRGYPKDSEISFSHRKPKKAENVSIKLKNYKSFFPEFSNSSVNRIVLKKPTVAVYALLSSPSPSSFASIKFFGFIFSTMVLAQCETRTRFLMLLRSQKIWVNFHAKWQLLCQLEDTAYRNSLIDFCQLESLKKPLL